MASFHVASWCKTDRSHTGQFVYHTAVIIVRTLASFYYYPFMPGSDLQLRTELEQDWTQHTLIQKFWGFALHRYLQTVHNLECFLPRIQKFCIPLIVPDVPIQN